MVKLSYIALVLEETGLGATGIHDKLELVQPLQT